MEAINLPIYNTEGRQVEQAKLDHLVFDGKINTDAMHQAVNAYRANQRKGLAATKTRGEVSGGGKKPWKQKGTGRARVGSIRSPLWRHGGVVFGPHPRDFSYSLSDKLKNLALKSSLNAKLKENKFIILDDFALNTPKTKDAAKLFLNLKVKSNKKQPSILLLLAKRGDNLGRALGNLSFLKVNIAKDTNVYEVLAHDRLIITKEGLAQLTGRLKK